MAQNIRIIMTDPSSAIPDFYKDSDGRFSFDLNQDTDVAITKQVDEATEIGSIRQDTVKNFELPVTEKNRILIGSLGNPQAFNVFHASPFPVQIFVGDFVLDERFAKLVGVGDDGGYEIEVTGDQFGWVKPISDQKLSSLDLGSFLFTEANVNDLQQNNVAYADGGDIINFPLVNYGSWPLGDRVAVEDFRFWFSPLALLQIAFCSIGWTFRCPILETNYGRRLWCYLLKSNFREASVVLTNKAFQATLTTDLDIKNYIGPIVFNDDFTPPNSDPGGNYDNTTGEYSSQVVADFFFAGEVEVVSAAAPALIISWVKIDQFGNEVAIKQVTHGYPNDGTFPVSLNAFNVELNATDSIYLIFESIALNTTTFQLNAGANARNIVKSAIYSRGDTIVLANLLDEDYYSMDLLKGIIHLFNLKPETDSTLKTVSFYPEHGAKDLYFEDDQEAFFFFNTKAKDWTDKIQCRSLAEDLSKDLTTEYLIGFAETTDPGVEDLDLDIPLHSKLITPDGDFEAGRTENFNPFFEPTRNGFDPSIKIPLTAPPAASNDTLPYMPHIWDSAPEENQQLPDGQATNIKPRIVLAYEYGQVTLTSAAWNGNLPTFGYYRREDGSTETEYLMTSQLMKDGVGVIGVPDFEDQAVVYGVDTDIRSGLDGNYEILYRETIQTFYFAFPIEFLILLTLNDLNQFSNRDRIFFKYFSEIYGELSIFSRVVKIEDFLINRQLLTPVQFLPRVNFLDITC